MSTNNINSKQVNTIFQTKELSKFKFREDNRTLNQSHIRRLTTNMKNSGWLPGSYVVVNEKYEIIDGQHRVKAAIEANVPIRYTMEKKADFEIIRGLNQNQRNWSLSDHIHGYVVDNNPHYIKLNNFIKTFPEFRVTECMMFLNNNASPVERHIFEKGLWVSKDYNKGITWANDVMSLKPFFEKGFNKSIFVRAIVKILSRKPEFKFEEFMKKLNLRPTSLVMCGTVEQYVQLIEDIYNYKRRNNEKVNLRF